MRVFLGIMAAHLQPLQVRPLHADDGSEQLVLQAVSGHREVHQGALGLQLGLVMRIGQLGVQDEAEARVVLALFVSNLDVPVTADGGDNNNNGRSLTQRSHVLPKKRLCKRFF